MSTLTGKKVVVIGGSSGIGYSVAKASLFYSADHVLIASSTPAKVEAAISRLLTETSLQPLKPTLADRVSGETVDLTNSQSIRIFFETIGEIDHLVITSGALTAYKDFREEDLDKQRDAFDLKFWGHAFAAQKAKIRTGGSITFSIGSSIFKPRPAWTLRISTLGALDALTRALAVELAPLRVNVVCPGFVDTELWNDMPEGAKAKMFAEEAKKLPVKHIASPDEVSEAYIFLMKCNFITGERLVVDGGMQLI